jgi:hypothetical protein
MCATEAVVMLQTGDCERNLPIGVADRRIL